MNRRSPGASFSGDLFEIPQRPAPLPGSMDFRPVVSVLVSNMLAGADRAGIDRHEVAARASRLSGKDVTKNMLDGYTAPGRGGFNVPLWLSPVLEVACESTFLVDWHANVLGGRLLFGAETLDAEIGRLMREREAADARLRDLKDQRRRLK
jgi:hypothetical protein